MKVLILGASGATGKLLVMQLLKKQKSIRIVVRETANLPQEITNNSLVEIIRGNITEFNNLQISAILKDCTAVVSCLGHNITFKGLFGNPRYLVYSTMKNLYAAIEKKESNKVKIILMSTTAYTNRGNGEKITIGEKILFLILKVLLPPHQDNMEAADFLIRNIGKDDEKIEWTAVRPDTLINEDVESRYSVNDSLIRSPLFNAGETSRINVSHFMAELLDNEVLWEKWKYKTPVVYNENKNE